MDPDGTHLWYLLPLLLLLLFNGFFAISQLSIVTLNDSTIKKMAAQGHKKAKVVMRLTAEPSRFMTTIQVGTTLSGLLAAALFADRLTGPICVWLGAYLPLQADTLRLLVLCVATLLLGYFILVFADLVPKRLAMHFPEQTAFACVGLFHLLFKLMYPFVFLLTAGANGVLRLMGINPKEQLNHVTEEEIRMMMDVGEEKGVIEEAEKNMINNIFEFDDKTAGDVMTHRTELTAAQARCTVQEVIALAVEQGYSRIPVYDEDIDNICGVIYAKDLLQLAWDEAAQDKPIEDYMRPALFIPESNRCTELMKTFKETKVQIAVVVDEYGGTGGVVTMEDLLEAIVGNIQDEYDNEEEEIFQINESSFRLDGSISPEEVERLLKIEIPNAEEYDTLGGLVVDMLEGLPAPDTHPSVCIAGVVFTVLQVEDRRIAKIKADLRLPPIGRLPPEG